MSGPSIPRVSVAVDADRDGAIGRNEPGRDIWSWGPDGHGAVVPADFDLDGFHPDDAALLRVTIDREPPPGTTVHLSLNEVGGLHATLWGDGPGGSPAALAGALASPPGAVTPPLGAGTHELWLQAHLYPDGGFDGLVQVFAELRAGGEPALVDPLDRVLLRVAPWLMPSTLCAPERLYVVANADPEDGNIELVEALDAVTRELSLEPVVKISYESVRGDVWIQDEIEPGYSHLPGDQVRHVVLDGPRNRGLDPVAEAVIGDDDVGVYEIPSQQGYRSSLDSFGNLEVSPPVPAHPLGRIVIGTKRPLNREGRRMALEVRQFLHNQHVQPLLETYTDWLAVGHIDEIVAFEPDPDAEHGFRVLIASPARFRALLQALPADAALFSGRVRIRRDPRTGRELGRTDAQETAAQLLGRDDLWAFNETCGEHLAEVRGDLQRGLGLDDSAFHEVPVAFRDEDGALAYFPDMVNHLVLGPVSIVPRPYGPSVDGTDALEEAFRTAAGPTRDVRFVDDWILYHEASGEIHCGTNVRRRPDLRTRWWETRPPTVYDAAIRR